MASTAISNAIVYSFQAEQLATYNEINYSKEIPLPQAIATIKYLVNMRHAWLDHPILRTIAKIDYHLTEISTANSAPSNNWQITLLGETLLIQKDDVLSVNLAHIEQQVVYPTDDDFEDEFNLGMDLGELVQRSQHIMQNAPKITVNVPPKDERSCVIM